MYPKFASIRTAVLKKLAKTMLSIKGRKMSLVRSSEVSRLLHDRRALKELGEALDRFERGEDEQSSFSTTVRVDGTKFKVVELKA